MRPVPLRVWVALALLTITCPAFAASPLPLTIGTSRDGSLHDLQRKLDRYFGAGRIQASADFIGAKAGDPDPWAWANANRSLSISILDRKVPHLRVGWYAEAGACPVLDGVEDEVLLDRQWNRGSARSFSLPAGVSRFGFFVSQSATPFGLGSSGGFTTYSNRLWNSPGPLGLGALHAPFDGDIQMLVYDISRWAGPDTWLVACESSDSGAYVGHGPDESDNDYSDLLFIVSGAGATPARGASFGQIKARYR